MEKFAIILLLLCITVNPVYAAKKRVRASAGSIVKSVVYSSAKLDRASHSVNVNFQNLGSVSKIAYELSYNAGGIPQGAMGTIIPAGSTDARNLYFGTCSKGVCTPHNNITGATLTIKTSLKSGGTYIKLYRIKI